MWLVYYKQAACFLLVFYVLPTTTLVWPEGDRKVMNGPNVLFAFELAWIHYHACAVHTAEQDEARRHIKATLLLRVLPTIHTFIISLLL